MSKQTIRWHRWPAVFWFAFKLAWTPDHWGYPTGWLPAFRCSRLIHCEEFWK